MKTSTRQFRDVSVRRRREAKLRQRASEDFCHAPGALKRHFETERDLYDRGLRAARANGLKLLRFSFEAVIVGAPIIRSARLALRRASFSRVNPSFPPSRIPGVSIN